MIGRSNVDSASKMFAEPISEIVGSSSSTEPVPVSVS